jgi:hypothetical protein
MSLSRAVASAASIFLGVSAAFAQQSAQTTATTAAPPVFQGLMVDAKGKTVGRLFPSTMFSSNAYVVRQINKVWVSLEIIDLASGFVVASPTGSPPPYYYQSIDCTGQAYLAGNSNQGPYVMAPVPSFVTAIPPATAPSIYFAGTPTSVLTMNSTNQGADNSCYHYPGGGQTMYVGPAESFPVSSLQLTLPFSIK